jgi:hypothetical protein
MIHDLRKKGLLKYKTSCLFWKIIINL